MGTNLGACIVVWSHRAYTDPGFCEVGTLVIKWFGMPTAGGKALHIYSI